MHDEKEKFIHDNRTQTKELVRAVSNKVIKN